METELQFIDHDGHRVAVLSGNPHAPGTPLIFLHGIAGSVHFWPALLPPSVREHRRWYSIGLPGHFPGGSSRAVDPADYASLEKFTEILATVIRRLSAGQPVALIGYSTGGLAALNLAACIPELVTSVVSISGFSEGRWHGILGRLQSLASRGPAGRRACAILWKLITFNSAAFQRLLQLSAGKQNKLGPDAKLLLSVVARDAKRQRAFVLAGLFAGIRRFDIRTRLGRIRVPVLIAGGNCDPIIRYQHTGELASAIRGAEMVTFRGVGHLFFAECPELFQEVLEEWIDRHCTLRELRQAA